MNIKELIGGIFIFIIGIYVLQEITKTIEIPSASLILGFFIVLGIFWFIKEVLGKR